MWWTQTPASRIPLKDLQWLLNSWSQAQSPSVPGHVLAGAAPAMFWARQEHKGPATLAWHKTPVRPDSWQGSAGLAETFLDLHLPLVFSLFPLLLLLPSSLLWCYLLTPCMSNSFSTPSFGCIPDPLWPVIPTILCDFSIPNVKHTKKMIKKSLLHH